MQYSRPRAAFQADGYINLAAHVCLFRLSIGTFIVQDRSFLSVNKVVIFHILVIICKVIYIYMYIFVYLYIYIWKCSYI